MFKSVVQICNGNWRLERQWTANICVSPGGKEACNCSILINALTHDSSIETSK